MKLEVSGDGFDLSSLGGKLCGGVVEVSSVPKNDTSRKR